MISDPLRGLAALALLAAGCGREAVPATAAATVEHAARSLAAAGDPGVLWDLLPPSWRSDLNRWAQRLGTELPAGVYEKAFRVLHTTGVLLKAHAEDLATFAPYVAVSSFAGGGAREEDRIAVLTAQGNIFLLLAGSEIARRESLAAIDLGAFLHGTGVRIWTQAERLYRISGRDPRALLAGITAVARAADGERATVAVTVSGDAHEIAFVHVEGRWVPETLAERFATLRGRADEWLARVVVPSRESFPELERDLDALHAELERLHAIDGRGAFLRAFEDSAAVWTRRLRKYVGR